MMHISSNNQSVCLVFYIKDHHLYPIQDNHLKQIATKANQGGADNLWKYMTDMKWSNKSSNYIMYQQLIDNEVMILSTNQMTITISQHWHQWRIL